MKFGILRDISRYYHWTFHAKRKMEENILGKTDLNDIRKEKSVRRDFLHDEAHKLETHYLWDEHLIVDDEAD